MLVKFKQFISSTQVQDWTCRFVVLALWSFIALWLYKEGDKRASALCIFVYLYYFFYSLERSECARTLALWSRSLRYTEHLSNEYLELFTMIHDRQTTKQQILDKCMEQTKPVIHETPTS